MLPYKFFSNVACLFLLLFTLLISGCSNSCNAVYNQTFVTLDSNSGGVANGAVNVSITPIIMLKFIESMNATTVNNKTVYLSTSPNIDAYSIAISNITASQDNTLFSFTPLFPLKPNTKYYVLVDGKTYIRFKV